MQKRVLVVDNEPGLAFFLAENLAELGPDYEISTCYSGLEALALHEISPFDLIISDLIMPGVNGLELARLLKQQRPETRLILMTAYGDESIPLKAQQLGLTGYITKPFSMEEMLRAVQTALGTLSFS